MLVGGATCLLVGGGACLAAGAPAAGREAARSRAPREAARSLSAAGAPVRGAWRLLPRAPRPAPAGPLTASVWTGRQMLVFGRFVPTPPHPGVDVAVAYTPSAGKWTRLAPLSGPIGNAQGGYHAVWTGREMLVLGPFDFQAFSPSTHRWRRLPAPPAGVDGAGLALWTGHEMVDWGGGCCGDALSAGWAFNPATNRWRTIAASPLAPSSSPVGVWTGGEMIVLVSGINPADGRPYPSRLARAAAYTPATDRWRRIAAPPAPYAYGTVFWDGHRVLLLAPRTMPVGRPPSPGRLLLAYSPSDNRWRQLASMPSGRSEFAAVWDGRRLLVWGGTTTSANVPQSPAEGLAYDPRSNRWSSLPVAPLRPRLGAIAAWTGHSMIIWGGWTIGTRYLTDGAAFTPAVP